MKMSRRWSGRVQGAIRAAAVAGWTLAGAAEERPNIVLFMADDFGYECVSANGGESYSTPHLDALAATGMRFERCHTQPLCTPTRVQLMTGIYNVRNYIDFGIHDPAAVTFGHLLRDAGYATGVFGKWQLGHDPELPRTLGFGEAFLWQHTRRPPRFANPGFEHNAEEIDFNTGEYGPKVLNDRALEFIERNKDRPFFLYYPMILTHDPFQPTPDSPNWDPKAVGERVNRDVKHFADMTAYMDKMIGRLVAKLDELGLRERTLVMFLGDNGTHSSVTSQFRGAPYPGGKGDLTARGTHVPFIANWPGRIPAGRVNDDLVASVDFLPTLCEAAGAAVPDDLRVDGRSFLPQLLGRPGEPRTSIYVWYMPRAPAGLKGEFVMSTTHKLYTDGRLFDLAADPFEARPLPGDALSARDAAARDALAAELARFADARPSHLRQSDAERFNEGTGSETKREGKQKQ